MRCKLYRHGRCRPSKGESEVAVLQLGALEHRVAKYPHREACAPKQASSDTIAAEELRPNSTQDIRECEAKPGLLLLKD